MSFLEKVTGHRLRMHNTSRVMSNSVGIVCTLGVLSAMLDDIRHEHGANPADRRCYERVRRLCQKTTELVEEAERTMDRALRLRMHVDDAVLFPFVQASLLVSEDVQRTYLDALDRVSKRMPPSTLHADPTPDPEHACVICVADLDRAGRVPPCPGCGRDDVCPRCDGRLEACPFCRVPF